HSAKRHFLTHDSFFSHSVKNPENTAIFLQKTSLAMLLSKLEADVYYTHLVDGFAILGGGLEADMFSRKHRLLIESVSKSVHNAQNLNLSRRCKPDFERDVALYL